MPPLRKRREDVPLLIDHFVDMYNQRFSRNIQGMSTEAMKKMTSYEWPGNIRELQHAVEHAFVLCREEVIEIKHLPPELQDGSATSVPELENPEDETAKIVAALEKAGWNKSRAARILGISRRTIYRKMEEHNIEDEEGEGA